MKLILQILFYLLMGGFALYSFTMVYILLRYGKSKILGLSVAVFYFILIASLYGAALANFYQIPMDVF